MQEKDILREFKKASKEVWGASPLIDKIDINVKILKRKNMMSLGYSNKPIASGISLIRVPTKMNLYISEEAMKLTPPHFKQLLRHESIHIGYPRHDINFRRIAEKHNIPITFNQSEGGGYIVQAKKGSRYSTIKTFQSLEDARKFAYDLFKNKKYEKIRVRY